MKINPSLARVPRQGLRSCVLLGLLACLLTAASPARAQDAAPDNRFSGPYTSKNLTIYLVHGPDQLDTSGFITLDEALSQKQAVVHETGDVNELSVENISRGKTVFIQAGDIVKGGKQDRVISQDLVLKPQSGKVPIASFCVEQGRWQQRRGEAVQAFSSSKKRLNSKALKLAAFAEKEQGKVWSQVSALQDKLERNVGAPVKSTASATSLQLSLETKAVEASAEAYRQALANLAGDNPDSIGYVVAINGTLNSAETYGAHALFKKVWPKLLDASATEALAEASGTMTQKRHTPEEIRQFLASAEKGKTTSESKAAATRVLQKDSDEAVYFETQDAAGSGRWVHKQYLKKN